MKQSEQIIEINKSFKNEENRPTFTTLTVAGVNQILQKYQK